MSVRVVLFDLDNSSHGLVPSEILSPEETRRAEAYRQDLHRFRFQNGRLWLRYFLAETVNISPAALNFAEKEGEKPKIFTSGEPLAVSWSLSRSEDLGAVVIATAGRVGIDIEKDRPVPEASAIASDFFSEEEREALRATSAEGLQGHFLRLWTAKEALTKAAGLGLSADLSSFTVNCDDPARPKLTAGEPPFAPEDWHLAALCGDAGWVGSLASDQPLGTIRLQDRRA
ncbi:MAG: 4'-phosphopantetheinyl transferase superfamily protein [Pseudomonadota bacterium]